MASVEFVMADVFIFFILLKFAFIQLCVIFVAMQKKQVDKKKIYEKAVSVVAGNDFRNNALYRFSIRK